MNEQIRKLFSKSCWDEQAEVDIEDFISVEKFAELVVQECIEQVEQAKNSPFVSLDDANRMKHFVDVTKKKIQKHFGVAE